MHVSMTQELVRQKDGLVTRLTLNRPEKANALSASLVEVLLDAVLASFRDGSRLLVLEGNGRHFCAGFDFTDFESQSDGDLTLRFIRIETLLQTIYHSPIETLALAHGSTLGAGADLVVACHHRIAASGTTFRMPGLRFGLVLGTRRLCHRVGEQMARDVLSTSRTFEAGEALQIGFATRIAERTEWPALVEAAEHRAQMLSAPVAMRLQCAVVADTRAEDMAALALSASAPGLVERIRAFRGSG